MLNLKTYSHAGVDFKYSLNSKKWEFHLPAAKFTLLTPCPGRAAMAKRVAAHVAGAMKRTNNTGLDGLARAGIKKLVESPA